MRANATAAAMLQSHARLLVPTGSNNSLKAAPVMYGSNSSSHTSTPHGIQNK
jgi:hypothetical protein